MTSHSKATWSKLVRNVSLHYLYWRWLSRKVNYGFLHRSNGDLEICTCRLESMNELKGVLLGGEDAYQKHHAFGLIDCTTLASVCRNCFFFKQQMASMCSKRGENAQSVIVPCYNKIRFQSCHRTKELSPAQLIFCWPFEIWLA